MRYLTAILIPVLLLAGSASGVELHPQVPLLDHLGEPVATTGLDVEARITCGKCHDTDYIESHSSHGAAGVKIDCFGCHLPDGMTAREQDYFTDPTELHRMISPPTSEICGQCHGLATSLTTPVEIVDSYLHGDERGGYGATLRTGEIFAGQRLTDSFLNLADKGSLARPWDIHAARQLECSSCHFAGNHPGRAPLAQDRGVGHLIHDPRGTGIEEFLIRPDHRLVSTDCLECHDPTGSHPDLPYVERHLATLACQACHVPRQMAPALRAMDRTVVVAGGGPRLEIRGVDHMEWIHPGTWFNRGYLPFLLQENTKGNNRFAPYNLVTSWLWISATDSMPVDPALVREAWLDQNGEYHPELLATFDADGDGTLAPGELLLDTDLKSDLIGRRLINLGVDTPRIAARVDAHPLRHGIADGASSASACASCHEAESRFNEEILLATGPLPGGAIPLVDSTLSRMLGARRIENVAGELRMVGDLEAGDHYIFGHSTRPWIDTVGFLFLLLTAAGVALHSAIRILMVRKRGAAPHTTPLKRVYMYSQYERVWHWVMALSIILLLLTGFQIHFPNHFTLIGFATAILLHNIMAAVLILNSFLSLFFHLATAEIKQFVPERGGLVKRILLQGRYYLKGIFQGSAHPIHKTPEHKLNPLQQITYTALLNFMFPLQILTGILLWVGGMLPELIAPIGGLAILAPVHNLGSWLFLSFLVMHVYLTTTGHTVTSNIQAMVDGWEYIESDEVKI